MAAQRLLGKDARFKAASACPTPPAYRHYLAPCDRSGSCSPRVPRVPAAPASTWRAKSSAPIIERSRVNGSTSTASTCVCSSRASLTCNGVSSLGATSGRRMRSGCGSKVTTTALPPSVGALRHVTHHFLVRAVDAVEVAYADHRGAEVRAERPRDCGRSAFGCSYSSNSSFSPSCARRTFSGSAAFVASCGRSCEMCVKKVRLGFSRSTIFSEFSTVECVGCG